MNRVICIKSFVCEEYKKISGEDLDWKKMNLLLYFVQRESLAVLDKPAFEEELECYRDFVVCKKVKQEIPDDSEKVELILRPIIRSVILQYGVYENFALVNRLHHEISWKNAMQSAGEDGNCILELDDLRIDAERVRA